MVSSSETNENGYSFAVRIEPVTKGKYKLDFLRQYIKTREYKNHVKLIVIIPKKQEKQKDAKLVIVPSKKRMVNANE